MVLPCERGSPHRSALHCVVVQSNQNLGACFDTFELSFIDCSISRMCECVYAIQ